MNHKLQVGEMKAAYLTDKEIWGTLIISFHQNRETQQHIIRFDKVFNRESLQYV